MLIAKNTWERTVLQKCRTVTAVERYLARLQCLSEQSASLGNKRQAREKIAFLRALRASRASGH